MKTALLYMYGMSENTLSEFNDTDVEEVGIFRDPNEHDCGGKIKWRRNKLTDLTLKGVCTRCGQEVTRHE